MPQSRGHITFDYLIEILFLLDICFSFCTEYQDKETYSNVKRIKQIAKNYLGNMFIFDLLAVIPFEWLWPGGEKTRLFRLFKWLRVPRLAQLLNVTRFKQILTHTLEVRYKV